MHGNYNPGLVWINAIPKRFLCAQIRDKVYALAFSCFPEELQTGGTWVAEDFRFFANKLKLIMLANLLLFILLFIPGKIKLWFKKCSNIYVQGFKYIIYRGSNIYIVYAGV